MSGDRKKALLAGLDRVENDLISRKGKEAFSSKATPSEKGEASEKKGATCPHCGKGIP